MYENYKSYYYDFLIPSFTSYVSASKKRLGGRQNIKGPAMKSAESLFHLRDYLKPIVGNGLTRKHVASLCKEYDIVGDVFNASKHKSLDRPERLIDDISAVKEVYRFSHIPAINKNPSYFYYDVVLMVFMKKYNELDFLKACTKVLNFWSGYLKEHELLNDVYYFDYTDDRPTPFEKIDFGKKAVFDGRYTGDFVHDFNLQAELSSDRSMIFSAREWIPSANIFYPTEPATISGPDVNTTRFYADLKPDF